MALSYSQLDSITEKKFIKKLVDNVYDTNALLARLTRPEKIMLKDGGTKIIAPIIKSKPGVGGYYSDLEELDISHTDDITAAEFEWKQIYEPIRISRADILKNSGDAAKLNLIASKVKIAEKNIKENLGVGLFSDGTASTGALTTKQITGLQATIDTSSTYGGIAVADLAEWVAVSKNNSGTDRALSMPLMQQAFGAVTYDDDKPTVMVCRQNVYDQLWSLYQPHQRLMSKEMAQLGFEDVLVFNGKPVIVDSHCEAQKILFLNEEYLGLAVHKDENMRVDKKESLETSNSMLHKIFWMGNLVCNGRRYQAELSDIEVAS